MTKAKEKVPHTEWWDCDDPRLPLTKDIHRTNPDMEFVATMREGQWQPIMVRHDSNMEQWYMSFGRKRLLACRILKEDSITSGKVWVRIEEGTAQDAARDTLIENAQRSSNEIGDYLAIRHILMTDATATYESIGKSIGKVKGYVKHLDETYARVPGWALDATLAGDIKSYSVTVAIGKLNKEQQATCKTELETNKKLPLKFIQDLNRFVKTQAAAAMFNTIKDQGNIPVGREFFNRNDMQALYTLMTNKKYNEALSLLDEYLA